ncbi:MAG: ABC transporter permease subunit [Proteobacteria bacterium]|nr:ABC transporter permease subunit [Pseudomonadota bacterium]
MTTSDFFQYLPDMFSGLLITLELMLASIGIGLFLAILLTLLSATGKFYFKTPIDIFVFFIRGTPLLVQIFIIYYGSGQWAWLRETFLWQFLRYPFGCASVALALNTAAYTTALLVGVIASIPKGEIEACQVLGFSRWQMLHRVILPRAWRIALPAYSNEVVMILKSTSLTSTITILDLMGVMRQMIARTYEVLPFFIMAGFIYLCLNALIIGIFKLLENRYRVIL